MWSVIFALEIEEGEAGVGEMLICRCEVGDCLGFVLVGFIAFWFYFIWDKNNYLILIR